MGGSTGHIGTDMAAFGSANEERKPLPSQSRSGNEELDVAVETILNHADEMSPDQLKDVMVIVEGHLQQRGDRAFTLTEEIAQNMRIIRKLRAEFFTASGARKTDTSMREMKDILTSLNTFEQTIGKLQGMADFQDRIRIVEKATAEALKALPEETQEEFFLLLEDNLIELAMGY